MPNQHRLGHDAAESAGLGQPDYDHDQMNQKDDEITHCGNDSSTVQFLDGESIQRFAMDKLGYTVTLTPPPLLVSGA
ncbi:MAG TPA: hypothetical protein VGR73_14385 [Bryobacteraceae bacterium]|nr:hypothetical protein [Bryobacteraceae bacterium]